MEGSSAHRSKSTNAMTMSNWIALGKELEELLRLRTPPVPITFSADCKLPRIDLMN